MLSLYLVELIDKDSNPTPGSTLIISGDEARHIATVARHSVGDEILLSDGRGMRAKVEIRSASKDQVVVEVIEVDQITLHPIRLTVVQALTKSDRAHECIELLVEAGVDGITPWQSRRSIGKWQDDSTSTRWSEWIKSAVKQSRRAHLPTLNPVISDLEQIATSSESHQIIAFDENAQTVIGPDLRQSLTPGSKGFTGLQELTLIIGPEGGIDDSELATLQAKGAHLLRLGQPVLRSAHAGAIALASVQSALEIWR